MRDSINLTDEQIEEQFGAATGCCAYADELVFSRDTISDYVEGRTKLAERGRLKTRTDTTLIIERVQASSGTPRGTLYVHTFGDFTASQLV